MGKQSRRKKGKKKGVKNETQLADTVGPTVLQRLRHADSRTRHAALAALTNTILDPERISSNKMISIDLLQAIRERVMDNDLECAQTAAGCLSNYLRGMDQQDHEITSGWTVIFIKRLKQCVENIKKLKTIEQQDTHSNQKQWWALTMQCLCALCSLVEINHQGLVNFVANEDSIEILLSILDLSSEELKKSNTNDSSCYIYINKAASYAAQTLHSALDDNAELMRKWVASGLGWDVVCKYCELQSIPLEARLHCAGSLVTARLMSENDDLQTNVIAKAMPVLYSCLDLNLDQIAVLMTNFQSSYEKLKKEEADSMMEKEVIRKVNERQEPARLIARRQKAMKEEKKKKEAENKTQHEDVVMEDESRHSDSVNENDVGGREAFELAREEWYKQMIPLELALEITANLTGIQTISESMGDADMNDIDTEKEGLELSTINSNLVKAIVNARIPNRLVKILKALCQPFQGKLCSEVENTIEDLQSKCGACLGNCVSEIYPNWVDGLVQELRCALEASNGNPCIANAMTAALRSRSGLRKQLQPSDLEILLKFARSSACQKEAIEMLGILCGCEIHDKEVNRKVCSTLLNISSKKASVINEILNALMDIYGDDQCHPDVFDSQNVLAYFQQTTSSFKKIIKCDEEQALKDEVDQWEETLYNSSRFISYKKGQL